MPPIALDSQDDGGVTLLAIAGGTVYLPRQRLRAWVYLGRDPFMRQAIIDTGAPACTFPRRVWSGLDARGDITWLTHKPALLRTGMPAYTILAGGSYRYQLGRVRLQFQNGLAPRTVIAICTDDTPTTSARVPFIVGLADVMHGRTLRLEASADGTQWAATLAEP